MKHVRTVGLAGLALGLAFVGFAADRSKPPSLGSIKPLKLPPIQRSSLANGLSILLLERHQVPSVEMVLLVKVGAAADPLNRTGAAALTADILDEGAGGRDALALADALDLLGADLSTSASWDSSIVRMHVPAARLKAALPIMADVALRPSFRSKDLERLRKDALTTLLQARDEPRQIAAAALDRAVFGDAHRYAYPETGDAKSVAAIKLADLRAFYGKYYKPGNAALIVVGDVDASVLPLIEKAFGQWNKSGGAPAPALPDPPQVNGRVVYLVDRPGAAQSVLRLGRVGPPRTTIDYHALQVMNTLLGGSFTSRLNDNLREQHGYAYGARSVFRMRRAFGLFLGAADVQTPSTGEALKEFVKELDRIRTPAKKEEIERARNYLALGYARDFETTRQIASHLTEMALYDLLETEFQTFVPRVQQVEVKDAQKVAQAHVDAGNMAVVVVGDRQKIEKPLKAADLGAITVWTLDDVMGPAPKIESKPAEPQDKE